MKYKFSISIDERIFDLTLKDQPNKSRFIEGLLRMQYIEDHKITITNSLKDSLLRDKRFIQLLFEMVHEKEAEYRRSVENIPEF